MSNAPASPPQIETPHSDVSAFLIERHYVDLGCDRWDSRRVQKLCAKFGDTTRVMAARLRYTRGEFKRRMETDSWSKQDGLILTILEREVDAVKGGVEPRSLVPAEGSG